MSDKDTIYRQDAIDAMNQIFCHVEMISGRPVTKGERALFLDMRETIKALPSAEPERVWKPCDIPPKHHRDVIVRGVEAIGGECVYKVMQWDVDTWRPKNYAPSITWLDWSEI